jgi:CheY-like chemotaxis protein/HPt (histidine-containing phosphotransfer) domain-containing protein
MEVPAVKGKRVLVAEDNEINQLVAAHLLKKLNAEPEVASDGIEALEKIKAKHYDLVLMDVQMPGLDGYETTRQIRTQLNNNVPIIAMTAFVWDGEEQKCVESGMNGYIGKPFTLEILAAAIEKTLAPSKQETYSSILSKNGVQVDLTMVYDVAGDDNSYVTAIVDAFLANMPPTIHKMEMALAEKDYDALYKAAHYAKSSFSIIVVDDVYKSLQTVEQNAKHKSGLHQLPSLIDEVGQKLLVAKQLLEESFKTTTASK